MTTQSFLEILENNKGKSLHFECLGIEKVPFNYHITEIKNVLIESVDCGGRPSSKKQTVVQLWLSPNEKTDYEMTTHKALSIFEIVDRIKPINRNAEIYFEYQATGLPTAHFEVKDVEEKETGLFVSIGSQITKCKPKYELEMAGTGCAPGSGCC